jgi:predicted O-linked N-acetylglucosamine transferase (SPINDLY family)
VVLIPPIHDDSLTPKIRDAADQVVVPTADLDGVRETIAGLQLDILVLADVGMDTTLYATAFARLAPVQVGIAAAWPVTTGVPTLDYMASFDVVCCLTLTYSRQPLAGWLARSHAPAWNRSEI